MYTNLANDTNQPNIEKTSYGYDSLLTVVKLATLPFYEIGTKLSFYDNKIFIQPPSYVQGAARKWYGNSKNELVDLFIPIKQCVDRYVFKENNSYVKEILRSSIKGLRLLQNTYSADKGVVLQIQFLINLVNDSLDGVTHDYAHLKTVFGDFEKQPMYSELWNDLSINVINKHLNSCNAEFMSLSQKESGDEQNEISNEKFLEEKTKLDGFIRAKEKRYSEFLG